MAGRRWSAADPRRRGSRGRGRARFDQKWTRGLFIPKASRVRGRGSPVLRRARGAVDARHGAMASVDVLHDASLLQV